MQYNNRQYKEQSVNTMTKGEMLILLYNEALKRLTKAGMSVNNGNYEDFETEVDRTREIIDYLMQTLDFKYPVSLQLYRMYDFINYELARAKAGRNKDVIDEILPFIVELRDTWKEADNLSKGMSVHGK